MPFSQHQLLFARSALASRILEGSPAARCPVPLPELHTVFPREWEGGLLYRSLGHFEVAGAVANDRFAKPITVRG